LRVYRVGFGLPSTREQSAHRRDALQTQHLAQINWKRKTTPRNGIIQEGDKNVDNGKV